jgi:ABC-type multidrug transport system fused ATPase/permease subunit
LKKAKILRKSLAFIKPYTASYFISLIINSAAETSIFIVIPFIIKLISDAVVSTDMRSMQMGIIAGAIEVLVTTVCLVLSSIVYKRRAQDVLTNMRTQLFAHLQFLPLAYFQKNHSGDIVARLSSDMDAAESLFSNTIRNIVYVFLIGIGSTVSMLVLDWRLFMILALICVVSFLINTRIIHILKSRSISIQNENAKIMESVKDAVNGNDEIKLYNMRRIILDKFTAQNDRFFDLTLSRFRISAWQDGINLLFGWINFGGVLAIGAFLYLQGYADLGTIVAMTQLLYGFKYMVGNMGGAIGALQNNLAGMNRILEVFEEKTENKGITTRLTNGKEDGTIAFSDVSFAYVRNKPVLDKIRFSARKGEKIAIIGPSGSGKSTIANLLLGFYKGYTGHIYLNGHDIENYSLEQLRGQIAYVPQDAYLFDESIESNIRCGLEDKTLQNVMDAAKAANAHEFISSIPQGYKAIVGERGANLSGGQRQRIALARGVLKQAQIVVLDEATSSLDSKNEQEIMRAFDNMDADQTVMIITHKLAAVKKADIIYFIEDGKIQECGSHRELLEADGKYAAFYAVQLREQEKSDIRKAKEE